MRPPALLLVLLSAALLGPALAGADSSSDPNAGLREALQAELEPLGRVAAEAPELDPAGPLFQPAAGPELTRYRERLGTVADWKGPPVWHRAGTLELPAGRGAGIRLGVNVFTPAGTPRGTLLFVHGYLSHAANFAYTSAWFTARGWRVVTLDLPGHGLSKGPRGDVGEFAEYGDAVALWLAWVKDQGWPGRQVLLAHSLGTAAAFEALRRPGTPVPDQVVFCAPLLRTDWYAALDALQGLVGAFVRQMPSRFGWDGYLDGYAMPVHWFTALSHWLARLENQKPVALPLTIFTGDRDSVVDEGWNLADYRRLVPGVVETVLPGRDHLFLAAPEDREAFHRLLDRTLDPPPAFGWTEIGRTKGMISYGVRPPAGEPRGTLFFVHGYRSNRDEWGDQLAWWSARGWLVTAVNLPDRVGDFREYGAAVKAWMNDRDWPGPRVVVAHSLGAAAVTEALRQGGVADPARLVFLAPLVRVAGQDWLRWASWLPAPDEARWLGLLDRWGAGLPEGPVSRAPLTVYAGDRDSVVDTEANRRRLAVLYPGMTFRSLPGADHWFAQEPLEADALLLRWEGGSPGPEEPVGVGGPLPTASSPLRPRGPRPSASPPPRRTRRTACPATGPNASARP